MSLLNWNSLLYLSFHLAGFLFCMVSMFGVPGQIDDDTNPLVRRVMKAFNIFLNLAWIGIPILLAGSILAFYLEWTMLGVVFSTISIGLGLATFFCVVTLYRIK